MTTKRWRKPEELIHHRVPGCFCPSCFILLDAVTGIQTKEKPEPGDFTVCINCGVVLKFADDMAMVMSSLMEIPIHSRMDFARLVTEIKDRGPFRGD